MGAIENAPLISSSMGHTFTGTEHLLLAMISRRDCIASGVLSSRNVDFERARMCVAAITGMGSPSMGHMPSKLTENFKKVLLNAAADTSKVPGTVTALNILKVISSMKGCGAYRVLSSMDALPVTSPSTRSRERFSSLDSAELFTTPRVLIDPKLPGITVNLTAQAMAGQIKEITGREKEIREIFLILSRKTKNNPCLTGPAGVGKTAIAGAVALMIARGKCPEALKSKQILVLDTSALLAGTKYRGDIEERIRAITDFCEKNPDVILFTDEIHTIVGAGASEGAMDTANLLKPALSLGTVRLIGATTDTEFEKYIEKDPALTRRLCRVSVDEPDVDKTLEILKNTVHEYEKHHGVRVDPDALRSCAELALRYFPDRYFPDKAIDLLDQTCSLVKLSQTGNRAPLVQKNHVSKALFGMTGIETDKDHKILGISRLANSNLADLGIFGQNDALEAIRSTLLRSQMTEPLSSRPICSFMFCGAKGVGKSTAAKALAKKIFGGGIEGAHFERFDMAQYSMSHSISGLIGAPAGYVGHDEGGALVSRVRRDPFCVLLFEGIEKAHPKVIDVIVQILDTAELYDGKGRRASFRNCIVVMTTEISCGDRALSGVGFCQGTGDVHGFYGLEKRFSNELLSQTDGIIPFERLDAHACEMIFRHRVSELCQKLGNGLEQVQISEEDILKRINEASASVTDARSALACAERLVTEMLLSRDSPKYLTDSHTKP
jgi:ATP-dependent Clp protease ATP-binding subunit ClpA